MPSPIHQRLSFKMLPRDLRFDKADVAELKSDVAVPAPMLLRSRLRPIMSDCARTKPVASQNEAMPLPRKAMPSFFWTRAVGTEPLPPRARSRSRSPPAKATPFVPPTKPIPRSPPNRRGRAGLSSAAAVPGPTPAVRDRDLNARVSLSSDSSSRSRSPSNRRAADAQETRRTARTAAKPQQQQQQKQQQQQQQQQRENRSSPMPQRT